MRVFSAIAASVAITIFGLAGCGGKDDQAKLAKRVILHPGSTNKVMKEWTIKQLPNNDTLIHGVTQEFYWSGANKKSVVWINGQRDGSAQAWYDNGKQQWQKSYLKGKKDNTWRLFYSDGNPWIILAYKDGELEGSIQRWERFSMVTPKEAVFAKGSYTSGDCNILSLPEVTEDTPPQNKNQVAKDQEILTDFLD